MKKFLMLTINIIVITIVIYFYINNKSNVTLLLKYAPFDSEYKNLYIYTLKVSSNLPKIDVTTAFYPLASSIVQSIYDENSYDNINHFEVNDMGKIIDKVAWNKSSIDMLLINFIQKYIIIRN